MRQRKPDECCNKTQMEAAEFVYECNSSAVRVQYEYRTSAHEWTRVLRTRTKYVRMILGIILTFG